MQYILLDLEWNGMPLYKTGGYFNEIIEFGAVKLNDRIEEIDTFKTCVRPTIHKKLTGRVKRLTHISNDEVKKADYFVATYNKFKKWVGTEENCFLTWGTGDILVILENFKQFDMPYELDIMDYYCDAQVLCQQALGIDGSKQPGLSAIAEQLGIPCDDKEMHRALDDSLVSAECLRRLWDKKLYEKLSLKADKEFIRRLTFKTVILCDIDNPHIKRSMFRQSCPVCNARMRRTTEIKAKNKSFTAAYHCPKCGRDFLGRHQFKLKYEGVVHKCTFRDLAEEANAPKEEAEQSAEQA